MTFDECVRKYNHKFCIGFYTNEERKRLCEFLDSMGYKWCSGDSLLDSANFYTDESGTAYALTKRQNVLWGTLDFHLHDTDTIDEYGPVVFLSDIDELCGKPEPDAEIEPIDLGGLLWKRE